MPVFSYAQAAKGAKAQAPPKPVEPSTKVEAVDLSAGTSTSTSTRPPTKTDSSSSVPSRRSASRPRSEDKDSAASTQASSTATASVSTASEPSADKEAKEPREPNAASAETNSLNEKDVSKKTDGRDSWEKASQSSHSPDKAAISDKADKDKTAKESEDDWEKVSVPSIAATDKELKAAPPPAVNIWAVRLEAQAAKKKEQAAKATVNGTHSPSETATSKPAADESKRKAGSRDTPDKAHSVASSKPDSSGKAASGGSSGSTDFHSSRPASQHGDKAAATARPPVDTTSWPTPDNATADERRKSSIQDKTDKDAPKPATTKGNKWITVPFVPTAKFETPLPALASKRGSRNGRGRDNQARAGAQAPANADRAEQAGAMGPPPVPNKTGQDQDRGRKSEAARGTRSSSLPVNHRRPTSRENVLATLRKPNTANKADAAAEAESGGQVNSTGSGSEHYVNGVGASTAAAATTPAPAAAAAAAAAAGSKDQSRTASGVNGVGAETAATPSSHNAGQNGTDSYAASATDAPARPSGGQERTKTSQAHYRTPTDGPKDRGSHRNRDWSREKSDAAREKVDSWRDRDFSTESTGRRERSDRARGGGGGGYRGRGGAQAFNSHQPHPYTAPLPQNGFEPAKPHHSEPRSRQSSQHFVPPSSSNSTRASNPRSHSIPLGLMYTNYYGVPGMQQLVPQLQPDIPPYAYAAGPVPVDQAGGIMSAMPYSPSLNSYAVMSMVVTQFEYYFSIDNLCKDMYLRKNMDSQGWVPLRVVANFKRIKALTEDNFAWESMRYVATQVRNVEYLQMADGEDKLRSRENWRDFVLPVEDRFPAAQSEGPQLPPQHILQQQQQPAQLFAPPPPPPPTQQQHPQANPDGLSAMSPPVRSPNAAIVTPNGAGFEPSPLPPSYVPGPISPVDGASIDRGFPFAPLSPTAQASSRESPSSQQKGQYPRVFRDRPTGQIASPTPNGHRRQASRNFTDEFTFPDEGIAGIRILVREPSVDNVGDDAVTSPQLSRVLSNESRGSAAANLGTASLPPEQSGHGLPGIVFGYSNVLPATPEATGFVNKDGLQSEIPADKPGQYFVSYLEAHDSAFRNRALGIPEAMSTLYSFWSSFLVDNFNLGMYQDFKNTSMQDLANGDEAGVKHLVTYFDKALKSQAPIADVVATDLAHFLRDEADGKARVYKILRMAWRNGALNLKTRKKIGDLLSDEEKASFDKGG